MVNMTSKNFRTNSLKTEMFDGAFVRKDNTNPREEIIFYKFVVCVSCNLPTEIQTINKNNTKHRALSLDSRERPTADQLVKVHA